MLLKILGNGCLSRERSSSDKAPVYLDWSKNLLPVLRVPLWYHLKAIFLKEKRLSLKNSQHVVGNVIGNHILTLGAGVDHCWNSGARFFKFLNLLCWCREVARQNVLFMSVSWVKNFAEESYDIFARNNFTSGYVLHKNTSKFSSTLILKTDELIDWNLNIAFIGKSFHHWCKRLIFSFSMRYDVEDGRLNCWAKILEGFIKSLIWGVQLHEVCGRLQQRKKLGSLLIEVSDFLWQNSTGEIVWWILW